MEKEIRDMNVKELKALAKERGIKRYYWLRKAQLIESLETETPPTEAPETEIMEAPENEIMEAPENEIMEAPENEIMEAPENEIMEAPETEIMEAPETEIMEAPETEIMEAPETEIMEAPETEIMEAPETEIMEAPETEIMEAPETEIMEAPETEIMDEPVPEIMDEPVPEIKKPVLSPDKMENISRVSSLVGLAKKQADLVQKAINKFADWLINYIPEPIRRTVNTRVEKLKKEIKEILENKKKLSRQEVNTTGESSTAQEVFTNKTEIKLVENGGRVKVYKTTGNLNFDLTDKIMEKITPIIETRTKVIHAFSCVIYRGQGEIIEYSKTFKAPPGTFSSLDDIKEYIRQCEQKRLDLEDAETWSKAYLPATATYNSKGVYEGRVRFTSVSTKIILSNEPLLGCGPLPKWLADKKCVYAIDKIDDNLCFWRCLVIHQRIMKGEKRPEEKTNRDALKLARDFYKRPNLKRENVCPTRLVDFENIAKQFKVNIRLFEPKRNDDKTAWRLVFGKNQFKKNLPCVDIGLFVYEDHDEKQAEKDNRYLRQGHCFFIKDIELLTKTWECVGCRQRFNRHDNYNRHVTGGTCGGGKTKLICPGEKFERIMNSTEKVFYGGNKKFSYAACQWIEKQSELIGRHIHHALCGHGGEYYVYLYAGKEKDSRAREIPVDGYEPKSNTIFQYHGCKWHGCPCQKRKERNSLEEELIAEERSADQRYAKTIELEKKMKEQGFKIVSVWECEKPELKKKRFCKKFRPYPYFIVYDFEAICQKINEKQTDELTITAKHIPVSVAINDNLTKKPSFIVEEDPKELIKKFVVELIKRASEIEETVCLSNSVLGVYKKFNEDDKGEQYGGYLINEARVKLSKETAKSYVNWVKQVPVFGFNSGRYDINMIKEYFVENLTSLSDVNVAKKESSYMFLSTPNFKFLDIKNFLAPGLSYDAWCRAYGCELQKLAFPYEWFDSFEKLNHIGPVKYEEFYSSLKGGITISQEEYQNFCDEFHKRGCVTMKDWLKEYNLADVEPFIEALEKTREQYYPDEIDLLKDAVSIPGISMTYVLNKALKMKKKSDPDLFAPGDPCKCKCKNDCKKVGCEKCKEIRDNCKICTKNEAYEMLTTGMIGGPSIVFCRHAEAGVSKIRSHIYSRSDSKAGAKLSEDAKTCRSVLGLDANSLYLFCSGQEMPCGKEKVFKCNPDEQDEIIQNVLNDGLFGFFEVDIEVPEQKRKRFSEFCPLFVISEVSEDQIPQHMKDYKINTGRKMIKNNKKLLGVMKAEKILLYSPLLKWYLNHGLQVTKIHRYISYTSGRPFKWFPEEVSSARRAADLDKNKKQLGDTAKLKGNSFYGKMIENLEKHISTKFTTDEKLIDKIFRSPFFEDLEEINAGVFEVRQRKRQVTITRPYQCGIAVYQLAKLRMLEFYYDFLDKFCDRRDFELIQMDTDSFYMALSANDFDDIIKPEMKELYKEEKKNWLVTDEYSKRVPGLFKPEFQEKRMIALTSKCYYADSGGDEGIKKFSCKGVSRRQNEMNWERYRKALSGSLDKARNIGFRKRYNHIVTYEQSKLGLSAYYDKRIVHEDGIHTSCL